MNGLQKKAITQSWLVRTVTYLANLIVLNLLFLVTSLPVVTMGVAASALFTSARALDKGETVVVGEFFRAFRQQFRQATLSWLLLGTLLLLLLIEGVLLHQCSFEVPAVMYVCIALPVLAWFCYVPWVILQSSYFDCTQRQQLHNALLLAVRLLPQTILMAALAILPVVLFVLYPGVFLMAWALWLFLYFAAVAGTAARAVKRPLALLQEELRKREL